MSHDGEVWRRMEEEPAAPQILLPCPICFRTFKMESLERHKGICQVMATKKRKVFDSAKQRIQGTDIPTVLGSKPVDERRIGIFATLSRKSASKPQPPPAASTWKEKHLDLIKKVREARGLDFNRCPYCERNFGDKAYDRHVEWCKDQQSRIPKSPNNLEAKERWEARTKYRAPPLRRSMRSQTRDKYSPTRHFPATGGLYAASDYGAGGNSLSGSRASLDSRASSTYSYQSYQPISSTSAVPNNRNNRTLGSSMNTYNSLNAYNANQTLGRATGSAFLRHNAERRSLRIPPSSPPPLRIPPPSPPPPLVTLTPINNNRTSALRASLRNKTNSNLNDSSPFGYVPKSPKPAPKSTSLSMMRSTPATTPVAPAAPPVAHVAPAVKSSRPSVLQLFTSAFSRSSPSSSAGNSAASSAPASNNKVKSSLFSTPGRRCEPEGLESKVPVSSCNSSASYPPIVTTITSKQKPSSRYSSEGYDPYLSAQQQMAELFNDNPKRVERVEPKGRKEEPVTPIKEPPAEEVVHRSSITGLNLFRRKPTPPPKPASLSSVSPPTTPIKDIAPPPPISTPSSVSSRASSRAEKEINDPANTTNMDQLEQDLKSILSEISQLGKPKSKEAWMSPRSPPVTRSRLSDVSSISNTSGSSNRSSLLGTIGSRASSEAPNTQPQPPPQPQPQSQPTVSKFCHSCGSAYPERVAVKFCCECGARRLYI